MFLVCTGGAPCPSRLTVGLPDPNDELCVKGVPISLISNQLHGAALQAMLDVAENAVIPTIQHQLWNKCEEIEGFSAYRTI